MTRRILLALLRLYRYWGSPVVHALIPTGCKFQPTCSQYASEAIAMHGTLRGGGMAVGRLARCHPFSRGGYDPVSLPGERGTKFTAIHQLDSIEDGRLANAALGEPLP